MILLQEHNNSFDPDLLSDFIEILLILLWFYWFYWDFFIEILLQEHNNSFDPDLLSDMLLKDSEEKSSTDAQNKEEATEQQVAIALQHILILFLVPIRWFVSILFIYLFFFFWPRLLIKSQVDTTDVLWLVN